MGPTCVVSAVLRQVVVAGPWQRRQSTYAAQKGLSDRASSMVAISRSLSASIREAFGQPPRSLREAFGPSGLMERAALRGAPRPAGRPAAPSSLFADLTEQAPDVTLLKSGDAENKRGIFFLCPLLIIWASSEVVCGCSAAADAGSSCCCCCCWGRLWWCECSAVGRRRW